MARTRRTTSPLRTPPATGRRGLPTSAWRVASWSLRSFKGRPSNKASEGQTSGTFWAGTMARSELRPRRCDGAVEFALSEVGKNEIRRVPLYKDPLSDMEYFFTVLPLEYLHHDDRINPRSIGTNIRGLIEEFLEKRPQLHVALAWWSPETDGCGPVKVFDGQHKAAAQIMLGMKELPVRVFVEPDTNVLLVANTNAGSTLRQVAFDAAVMRHLGSSLFTERVRQYQGLKGLPENNYSFSEKDLVTFFRGEHREMLRYIIDAVRDSITHNKENGLMEFVEWAGKGADRPLSYSAIERTFFREFIYKKALETPIDEGMERGENPRVLRTGTNGQADDPFAKIFFVGKWDPETGAGNWNTGCKRGTLFPKTICGRGASHAKKSWEASWDGFGL